MTRLGSINLEVPDIEAAERFYTGILGLTADEERSNRPSFVLLRTANCMLILQHAPEAEPATGQARIELGLEVADLAAVQAKLGSRGNPQKMGWGDAIETLDPAGNRLNVFRLH